MTNEEIVVAVDGPTLVALIGAAGAGKTTLAGRLFAPAEVLSSDEMRAVIGGDAADQRSTRPAFAALHREVSARLAAGRLVVVDATSVEREARRSLLNRAALLGVPAIAIVLAFPAHLVHARNAARSGRHVAPDVVDRHLARVARLLVDGATVAEETLRREGFARVVILGSDDDAARLRVVRGSGLSRR